MGVLTEGMDAQAPTRKDGTHSPSTGPQSEGQRLRAAARVRQLLAELQLWA